MSAAFTTYDQFSRSKDLWLPSNDPITPPPDSGFVRCQSSSSDLFKALSLLTGIFTGPTAKVRSHVRSQDFAPDGANAMHYTHSSKDQTTPSQSLALVGPCILILQRSCFGIGHRHTPRLRKRELRCFQHAEQNVDLGIGYLHQTESLFMHSSSLGDRVREAKTSRDTRQSKVNAVTQGQMCLLHL